MYSISCVVFPVILTIRRQDMTNFILTENCQVNVARLCSTGFKASIGNWTHGPLHLRWLYKRALILGAIQVLVLSHRIRSGYDHLTVPSKDEINCLLPPKSQYKTVYIWGKWAKLWHRTNTDFSSFLKCFSFPKNCWNWVWHWYRLELNSPQHFS